MRPRAELPPNTDRRGHGGCCSAEARVRSKAVDINAKLSRPVRLLLKAAFSAIAIGGLIAGIHWQELPAVDGWLQVGVRCGRLRWPGNSIPHQRAQVARCPAGMQPRPVLHPFDALLLHLAFRGAISAHLHRRRCLSGIPGLPLVEPHSRAVTSVVIDRIVGVAALLFRGAVGSVFLIDHFRLPQGYLTALGFGSVAAVAGAIALYLGWFRVLRRNLQHLKMVAAIQGDLLQLLSAGWRWLPLLVMSRIQLIALALCICCFWARDRNRVCGSSPDRRRYRGSPEFYRSPLTASE